MEPTTGQHITMTQPSAWAAQDNLVARAQEHKVSQALVQDMAALSGYISTGQAEACILLSPQTNQHRLMGASPMWERALPGPRCAPHYCTA